MRRQCLITGGMGGLGKACAEEWAAAGWRVDAPGREFLDVRDSESVSRWMEKYEKLDLCVCNAGITMDMPLARMDELAWDEVMGVNLTGAMRCARAAARLMLKQRSGHIVFISSYSAYHPPVGQVNYAAAKASLEGLALSLARELGGRGIRVNVIVPGFMETKMTEGLKQAVRQAALDQHVLGAYNTPARVARFIRFLDEEMLQTSGQIFNLDSRIM